MNAASGTARTGDHPEHGTEPKTTKYPRTPPRLLFPAAQFIGLPAGHLKDASGAARAAQCRGVKSLQMINTLC